MASVSLAILAEGKAFNGQTDEALAHLREAAESVSHPGERYFQSELYRLGGEILLGSSHANSRSTAERCFNKAIVCAQEQAAKSWELRAVISLARLHRDDGNAKLAEVALSPSYSWFHSCPDTADLVEARSVMDAVRS